MNRFYQNLRVLLSDESRADMLRLHDAGVPADVQVIVIEPCPVCKATGREGSNDICEHFLELCRQVVECETTPKYFDYRRIPITKTENTDQ